jgi:hypothetical protein
MRKRLFPCFTALILVFAFVMGSCQSSGGSYVDTYTHASTGTALTQPGVANKKVLEGAEYQAALNFLVDSSHYMYEWKDTPTFQSTKYPHGFDENWRSPANGRVYRGPYYDPLCRSVAWLTVNPNGSVNTSLGSYWGMLPPNKELPADLVKPYGFVKKNQYQAFSIMGGGESVQNWINRKRGTLAIDGSLAEYYGVPGARHLFIEVKLDHWVERAATPEEYYDGLLPETISWGVTARWADHDPASFKPIPEYWKLSEAERADYIAKAKADPAVMDILTHTGGFYLWFDVMQIVNITDLIGFEYESSQGKVNGIDMDHDGYLDKYPAGHEKAGQLILSGGTWRAPEYALYLNYNDPWWMDYTSTPGAVTPIYGDRSVVPDPRKK